MRTTKGVPNLLIEKRGKWTNLYTKKAYPYGTHFEEKQIKKEGVKYRQWDPSRSKLGAAIMKGADDIGLKEGDTVLYLGAGHGYTPSFISDIIGKKGMIFAVDFSPRVVRDLIFICELRDNMAPIVGNANKPDTYKELVPKQVDVVFQDVAQRNQVEIFLKNIDKYLKPNGYGLLAVKARSIDVKVKPDTLFKEVNEQLQKKVIVLDRVKLDPYEKDHAFFICKKR